MLTLLLLACSPETPPAPEGVTYYKDVQPLVAEHCVRCHTEGGQAVSFDEPEAVISRADTIVSFVSSGYMPPPAPDASCADYEGSDGLSVDGEELALLEAWASSGAPLGDAADTPAAVGARDLAPFDLELTAPAAYTPVFDVQGNDYQCFLVELGNTDTKYLTGLQALPDNLSIVHHIVVFDVTGVSNVSDDPGGFKCSGFGENGWDFVTGWAPGGEPLQFPEGMGMPLQPETRLVLQMHYYATGPEVVGQPDQSSMGFKLADAVDTEIYMYPVGIYDFVIPANNTAYTRSTIIPWQNRYPDLAILGVFPHMHQLGTGFDMAVSREEEDDSCVVHLDGWDFHNQVNVLLTEEIALKGGDTLTLSCEWDNTANNPAQFADPPAEVVWGEGSHDEMCFGFTYGYFL